MLRSFKEVWWHTGKGIISVLQTGCHQHPSAGRWRCYISNRVLLIMQCFWTTIFTGKRGAIHGQEPNTVNSVLSWAVCCGNLLAKKGEVDGYVCPTMKLYGSHHNKPSWKQLWAWLLNRKSQCPFDGFLVFRIALVTYRDKKSVKKVLELPLYVRHWKAKWTSKKLSTSCWDTCLMWSSSCHLLTRLILGNSCTPIGIFAEVLD